jgi:hypothetical protein
VLYVSLIICIGHLDLVFPTYICHVTRLDFLYQGTLLISTHTNTVYVVD